jgi:ADP-ribose pyrophosphatase YjhB (NUDIX family)
MKVRVVVILLRGAEILLMKHRRLGLSYWVLPGGGIKEGETVAACARREMLEETGLEVNLGKLVYVADVISPDRRKHTVNLFFLGEIVGGESGGTPAKTLGEHLDEPQWFPLDHLPTLYPPIGDRVREDAQRGFPEGAVYLGNLWTTEPGE